MRSNAIGALRLILAAMVVFAHCPELLDGDRHREPLTRLFHTDLTLGSVAVDGFFLLSGYLITASFTASPRGYFLKRALRIYPAFIVCSLLSVLVVGPAMGGLYPRGLEWLRAMTRMATLQTPLSDRSMAGMHIETLNASMWTIAYEARCYVLAAACGVLGLYRRPRLFLGLALAVLALTLLPLPHLASYRLAAMVGHPAEDARLTGAFMVGACYRLFRPALRGWAAILSALAATAALALRLAPEIAVILLGGYALFWVALQARWRPLLTLNAKDDISYGLYLYAWPASALLIWFGRWSSPVALDLATLAVAVALGAASWFLIEKPALGLKTSLGQHRTGDPARVG